MKKQILAAVFAMSTAPVWAAGQAGIDTGRLFFGAGVSQNDSSGATDEGTGFQIFGGYEFGQVAQNVALDLEVGYMDSGDIRGCVRVLGTRVCGEDNATGLWATGVGRLQLNPQIELLGRAGFDFGDDDGFMVGIGIGFNVNKQTQLRFEVVERDDIDSLQFNFVYRP